MCIRDRVEVASASGMTTVSKAGSTLQMKVAVTPAEAINKGVTWSVTTKSFLLYTSRCV